MTGSMKMARLDYATMKSYAKTCLVLALITIYFAAITASITVLCFTCAWFVALMISNIFVIQEKNNLYSLYGSLSLCYKDIVCGRYIFMIISHLLSVAMAVVVYYGFTLFSASVFDLQECIVGVCLSILAYSVIIGVQTPIYFKMGYAKAKLLARLPFFVIVSLPLLPPVVPVIREAAEMLSSVKNSTIAVSSILVSGVVLFVSYLASLRAYKKHGKG